MDIDIDFPTTFDPLTLFDQAIRASMVRDGIELVKHPCGIYFQNMPTDPVTGFAAIPYKRAFDEGYFKIDFLHLSILDNFESKDEIRALIKSEPDWEIMQTPKVIEKLFHLQKWPQVIDVVNPHSVNDVADCLALIRPKKMHLLHTYQKNKVNVRKELYTIESGDKTSFKRAHAISYALVIVLQLHLIGAGIL